MQNKPMLFLVFLSGFFSFDAIKASSGTVAVGEPIVYKTSNYHVACCPQNCCPDYCSCSCGSCAQKPCVDWDADKKRLGCCIYNVLEQSGRDNEKRGCTLSCEKFHISCVNCGVVVRNRIGNYYDRCRECTGRPVRCKCDWCGCCIRKIEVSAQVCDEGPVVHEPIY